MQRWHVTSDKASLAQYQEAESNKPDGKRTRQWEGAPSSNTKNPRLLPPFGHTSDTSSDREAYTMRSPGFFGFHTEHFPPGAPYLW